MRKWFGREKKQNEVEKRERRFEFDLDKKEELNDNRKVVGVVHGSKKLVNGL